MQSKDINTKLIIYTIIFIYAMKDSCEKFIGIGLYIYIYICIYIYIKICTYNPGHKLLGHLSPFVLENA